ncbi:hypothetical protein GGS24DRAFT_351424 [Hypoxylon argillaceum]|nr:hypothetical protein GGS24DRAFT_351424 [Hypoxylon argillaceum]
MPRPKMPPTPASSTEIKGQDHSNKLSSLQLTFELPPSAITPAGEVSKSSSGTTKMSPVSPTPSLPYLQPSETVKSRRRSTAAATAAAQQQQQQKETFALPPPPTRSRKIIQMKPACATQDERTAAPSPSKGGPGGGGHGRGAAGSGVGAVAGSKVAAKKQPSATSAAGRKIARKTAHSLIERRRRSKMNEEFAVLKGLIPACTGEMHKLAILQASIEYVRYLEDCITKLKAQRQGTSSTGATTPTDFRPMQRNSPDLGEWTAGDRRPSTADAVADEAEAEAEDIEMTEASSRTPTPSPTLTSTHSSSTSVSPALGAQYQTYGASSQGPGGEGGGGGALYLPPPLASPALRPQLEIDHEVSAALLMLGAGRGSGSGSSGRGMSVRDLLSS